MGLFIDVWDWRSKGGFLAEGFETVGSGPLGFFGVVRSCWASSEEIVLVMI